MIYEYTIATLRNMQALENRTKRNRVANGGVILVPPIPIAYSPTTGEEYSANPGDYWDRKPDEPLLDQDDQPMYLAYKRTMYLDVLSGKEFM